MEGGFADEDRIFFGNLINLKPQYHVMPELPSRPDVNPVTLREALELPSKTQEKRRRQKKRPPYDKR
jgi:hypothetical protein